MKTIYENDYIYITKDCTEDMDFGYTIFNKIDDLLEIYLNGMDDYITITNKGWIMFIPGDYTEDMIRCILENNGEYKIGEFRDEN